MILGKTYIERLNAKQSKLAKKHGYKKWFAWRPVHLIDGRWAWRQWILRNRNLVHKAGGSNGTYFMGSFTFFSKYAEIPEDDTV